MINFGVFVYFFTFCLKAYGTEAVSMLKVEQTEENFRSKHMVRYHHTLGGEYPYSLSLQLDKGDSNFVHICGATLIKVQDVMLGITSASCLQENDPDGNSTLSLVAGVVESNRTKYEQRRSVCAKIIHEDYLNESMDTVHPRKNDVALIFINLKQPFDIGFEINVFPIELPTSREQIIEEPVISIGWEVVDDSYFISHVFQTPTLTRKQCVDDFYLQTKVDCLMALHISHICAANEEPFEAGTQSRGSPIIPANERYLAAIWSESYSKGSLACGPHPTPAVYTSMPYHRDWINRQVELYNKEFSTDEDDPKFLCT